MIRFLLGVAESGDARDAVFLKPLVYKERAFKANTFLFLGNPITVLWMSVLSGYLVDAFGWRGMFIIEGVPAIIWAAIWWFILLTVPRMPNG
ncbi:hypothetical protein DMH17_01335 [Raoultella planticola]|nr:hypothetical protein [Raoultella planticola]